MTVSRRTMLGATLGTGAAALIPQASAARVASVERWGLYEIALDGPAAGNPFDDVQLAAVFEFAGKKMAVPGFYDGQGVYRVRFSPPSSAAGRGGRRATWPLSTVAAAP
ncbi:DUF5060 domain-containing protein [Sphingomonas psychrotolerans]|uniref:DUF5060 domain-containing protein n=1 Tax=Sphingomonas psychrotolerans TaxID=1327635 RepID=UPI0018F2CC88|nr:DUF5060 domain-containing protein [Sphingomonas psychrotolerans]